jgi:iron complex outermembrane receptor protein
VKHPVGLVDGPTPSLVNRTESTRTSGGELLLRWVPEPFHVTGSYTFVRSSEEPPGSPGERRETYLTPRHQAGLVTMWELEGRARVGVEAYYTGRQRLEDPFGGADTESASYVHLGALAERRFGPVRVFINGENLLDYRQAEHGRFVLATRRIDGRWTADAWGPLEGRVANVGVRVDLFPDG